MFAARASACFAFFCLLLLQGSDSQALPDGAFLESVEQQINLTTNSYTVSGTHFAQGYTTEDAKNLSLLGMQADCDNININKKLSTSFRDDVFGPNGMKGFFFKCEKMGDRNKYWFTITTDNIGNVVKLCDSKTVYPIVYDSQHDTYWRDEPFNCDGAPSYAMSLDNNAFLGSVATQMKVPADAYTVSGTHFAQGYITEDAKSLSVAGMQADCDNININKKLSASFRSDVFGPHGMKGFFYKCEKVADRNKYWFTVSTGSIDKVMKLCNNTTVYPIVYDSQHDTYWRDEPFTCVGI